MMKVRYREDFLSRFIIGTAGSFNRKQVLVSLSTEAAKSELWE